MGTEAKYDPSDAFLQLRSPDGSVRLSAAKWLHRQALAEMNRWTDEWLRHPDTIGALLPSLSDAEPLVVEEAIGAACGIAERYRRDDRLLSLAVKLMSSERPQTRLRAAVIVLLFDPRHSAEYLIRLFSDPDKSVRAGVMQATAQACQKWPIEVRQRVRVAALERLRDRVTEVRCHAANLLSDVGEVEDVSALKTSMAEVKGGNYRQEFREAIQKLQHRVAAQSK